MSSSVSAHPHQGTPLQSLGSELNQAKSAMILLHGRGASAEDILGLAQAFTLPANMVVMAPEARGSTWYPQRLIAPLEMNEPFLSSALERVSEVVALLQQSSIPAEKIIIGGFSQGASLSIEFVLRNARRWGGLLAFSGGHIWPLDIPRQPAPGSLSSTPVFLGCSDVDPHIPLARVEETAAILQAMGAQVTKRIYQGMGHSINQDEIDTAQALITAFS